jgi:two-component system KDP operon response regulator KdpE
MSVTNPEDKKKLLVIEDEAAILIFLRSSLESSGWDVLEARTGRAGLELAVSRQPDAILLDLGLPDQEGMDVLKGLRQWTSTPIIIISARGQEHDKVRGLNAGADDYLTKPFGIPELMARLKVATRHALSRPEDAPPVYEHRGLKVDLIARRVMLRKKEVHLSPTQYKLLAVLVRHAGRVVRQDQLIKEVWGQGRGVTPEALRIFIYQLRHKIEPDPVRPRSLKTEAGVGYRLGLEESDS